MAAAQEIDERLGQEGRLVSDDMNAQDFRRFLVDDEFDEAVVSFVRRIA